MPKPLKPNKPSEMKLIITSILAGMAISAGSLTTNCAYAGEIKSYVELQRERIAAADAAYARFRQEQDAAAQANKEAAEARAWQNSHNKKDRLYQRQQERIAAASAPRVNVSVTQ
jgi:hypothetical protein